MTDDKVRWGIMGTGKIAQAFAQGLSYLSDAELFAVGSRSQATADGFADQFNIPNRHASYEALAHDPKVDVIYVATPHPFHKANSLLCLRAGKAVLCEKPFTINASEADQVISLAREKRLFLMEAMWTRFFPAMIKLRQLLAEGAIGEVRMLAADFGFRAEFDPQSRLFAPELGGGALLDVGIYAISLASMIFGRPARTTSMAHIGETGVDEQAAIILGYARGQLATLFTALRTHTPIEAVVMGTEGYIKVRTPMYRPHTLALYSRRGSSTGGAKIPEILKRWGCSLGLERVWRSLREREAEVLHFSIQGNGYNYEAAEVMHCLRTGKLESDVMPLDETLSIMRTLDRIRTQWGLKYPVEE